MISVILPTYNREAVLLRSIQSVLEQTVSDLELIVADDGSTDGTEALMRTIDDPRLRYLRSDQNQGACAARNRGIDAAKGEWIAFMDSDDTWTPNKLKRMLEIAEQSGADVCFHRLRRHYPNGRADALFPELSENRFVTHEELLCYAMISTQTIIARRAVCEAVRFDPKVRKKQDYDWAIRASRTFRFYYAADVLADQYYQQDSISAAGLRVIVDTHRCFSEKYADEAKAYPPFALYLLKIIAKNKTLLGERATEELEEIARLEGGAKNRIKAILARIGVLPLIYRMRKDRTEP